MAPIFRRKKLPLKFSAKTSIYCNTGAEKLLCSKQAVTTIRIKRIKYKNKQAVKWVSFAGSVR